METDNNSVWSSNFCNQDFLLNYFKLEISPQCKPLSSEVGGQTCTVPDATVSKWSHQAKLKQGVQMGLSLPTKLTFLRSLNLSQNKY